MKRSILGVVIWAALSSFASASPIILSGPGWTTAPYQAWWNNPSYDRNGFANIGVYLTQTPGSNVPSFYVNSPALTSLEWLGDGTTTWRWDTTNPPNFYNQYQLLQAVTDWKTQDRYYPMLTGDLVLVTPAGTWSSSTLDGGRSHFALFRSGSTYYLGMEDATWGTARTADWDYNDKIISWQDPTPVPEPGSVLLVATGFIAVLRRAFGKTRMRAD
jgi:hypothetical protein